MAVPGSFNTLKFRKPARCEELDQSGCVEVAKGPGFVAVRDSAGDRDALITVSREGWRRFVRGISARTMVAKLPCDETAPSLARRTLRRNLAGCPRAALDDVVLCADEIVTNAVLHSGTPRAAFIVLVVVETRDRVRVEVLDDGTGADLSRPEERGLLDEGGRGMFIVGELSSAFGVYDDGAGQNVWFEVSIG
jgi:anti-sigma regulatory factor (Ser/Thr protein kinase)